MAQPRGLHSSFIICFVNFSYSRATSTTSTVPHVTTPSAPGGTPESTTLAASTTPAAPPGTLISLPLRVALTCDPHTHMAAPGAAKASAERRFPRKQTTAEELAAKQPASRAGWRGLPGRRKRARLRGGKRRVVWSGRPRTCENKKRTMVHLFLKLWNTLCRDSGKFLKLF
jgi:hypothetical protein